MATKTTSRTLHTLKAERLKRTANVLCEQKHLQVAIQNAGKWSAPSWWEEDKRLIVINRDAWASRDPVTQYLNEKACAYHEFGHVRYTRFTNVRKDLQSKAHDVRLYLDLGNIIEDGRIEAALKADFKGMAPYLDFVGVEFAKTAEKSRLMDLAHRVRYGAYLFHGAYWAPFDAEVARALQGTSKTVWEVALDITNALVPKPKMSQRAPPKREFTCHAPQDGDMARNEDSTPDPTAPPMKGGAPSVGPDAPSQEQDDAQGKPSKPQSQPAQVREVGSDVEWEDDLSEQDGDGEADSKEQADDEQAEEGQEQAQDGKDEDAPADDAPEGDDPSEGDEEAEDGQPEPKAQPEVPSRITSGTADEDNEPSGARADFDAAEYVQSAKEAARKQVETDLKAELADLAAELVSLPVEKQDLKDAKEHDLAERIAAILSSIKVEAHRTQWAATNRHGSLDNRRLVGAITGDGCLRQRQSKPGFRFATAIVIDASGSMMGSRMATTLAAARAINAALERVQVPSRVVFFDDKAAAFSKVPEDFEAVEAATPGQYWGGSTRTDLGMMEAVGWLEQQEARRLVLVLTDGSPNGGCPLAEAKQKMEDIGAHVVSVQLEMEKPVPYTYESFDYDGPKDANGFPTSKTKVSVTGLEAVEAYAHRNEWVPDLDHLERTMEDLVADFAAAY